ncbi:MAG TPA: GTPase HflX, partial [Burkholderiaceae bacterium]|nr:GTPase HflX [Burkholderiaceae bacterium]
SAPDRDDQIAEVQRVLDEIGAGEVPMLMVYNKIDAAGWQPEVARDPCGSIKRVMLSARTGDGLQGLRDALVESLAQTVQGGDPAGDPESQLSEDSEAPPENPSDPSHLDAAPTDRVCGP